VKRTAEPTKRLEQTARVHIVLFAAYREALGERALDVPVAAGATVSDVFDALAAQSPNFGRLRPFTTFALNREVVPSDTPVRDGDELAFLQPVSGGADD
jgi:molybdopterin synthase catalytic subunit